MYCHLCRVDGSPSHDSSSVHRAAKELAAVAVDRLSDHLAASVEDDPNSGFVNLDDFLNITVSKPPAENKTNKNKTEVFFCDSCNVTVAVSDLQMHRRQKNHTLALFNEQMLEELVGQFVDKEHRRLMVEPMRDPQVAIDESEAVKTYTCHLCGLAVPVAFKALHEWGLRHLACRALAVAASKRTRDALRSADKSKDKSGDRSEDKCKDGSGDKSKDKSEDKPKDVSGDRSEDKPKFNGKMMKKLLKLYTGKGIDEDSVEDADGETAAEPKRLSTKEYFTDILPYLSYVAKFNTLIVDDTDYVTIQIGRDTLRIHVNNYNGIRHYDSNDGTYMNCHLCYGCTDVRYSCTGQQDKSHVMSLGHIRNLLLPINNVHLIRHIDDKHAVCALCNIYVAPHHVDDHVLKYPDHTAALYEALERGKAFKDSKKHLKIMIFKPTNTKTLSSNQIKWSFGIPQAPLKHKNSGVLFGSAQSNDFGSAQIQSQNSAVKNNFNSQSAGFGALNKPALFGGAQNNIASFGSAQNNVAFGNGQNNTASIGWAQNNGAFGSGQNNTASIGWAQNNGAFGSPQSNVFGSQNKGASVPKTLNARFGGKDSTSVRNHISNKVASSSTQTTLKPQNKTSASVPIFGSKTAIASNPGQTKQNTTAANDKDKNTSCAQDYRFFQNSIETRTNINLLDNKAAKAKSPTSSEKKIETPIISNDNAGKTTPSSPENKNGDGQCEANNGTDSTQAKLDEKKEETKPSAYNLHTISFSSSDSDSE